MNNNKLYFITRPLHRGWKTSPPMTATHVANAILNSFPDFIETDRESTTMESFIRAYCVWCQDQGGDTWEIYEAVQVA